MMKQRKHIIRVAVYALIAAVTFVMIASWVSGWPEVRAQKLYKNKDFRESACQLYLWMKSKDENAVILSGETFVYYSENERTELLSPWCDYAECLIQNGIWHVCCYHGVMELKLDQTMSGRQFALWLSAGPLPDEPLLTSTCCFIGQYAVNERCTIDAYFYEGYGDDWEFLKRTFTESD